MTDPAETHYTWSEVRTLRDKLVTELSRIHEVNGIGIGVKGETGEYVLTVRLTEPSDAVPEIYEGVPVVTQVIGQVAAQ